MRRAGAVALMVGAFAFLPTAPAHACSCVGSSTAEHYARADAVFTGRLAFRDGGDPALHVFAVQSVYKGEVHANQGVLSNRNGASCGLELRGPGPFLVFASRTGNQPDPAPGPGQYTAGLCNGSASATPSLEARVAALRGSDPAAAPGSATGAPTAPLPGAAGVSRESSPLQLVATGGLAVTALWLATRQLRLRRVAGAPTRP